MKWTWKNGAGYAGVAFSVWLISYIVEWNARNGGKQGVGDALLHWWGDLVMLEWVKGYQSLLAGLMAMAAGAFILLNSTLERRARRIEAAETKQQQYTATLSGISTTFRHVAILFIASADKAEAKRALDRLEERINELAGSAPQLTADLLLLLGRARIEIDTDLRTASKEVVERNRKTVDAYLECGHHYLKMPGRFLVGGAQNLPIVLSDQYKAVLNWPLIGDSAKEHIGYFVRFN